jgi:hypothetical protein
MTVGTALAPSERPTGDATRLRAGRPGDAEEAGRICYEAFRALAAALYTKLGFDVQEAVVSLQGPSVGEQISGFGVRTASEPDLEEMGRVCRAVHDRSGEVVDAIRLGSASIVVHDGSIVGYTTGIAYFGHSVATSNQALAALIPAAAEFGAPGLLLPVSNGEVFRWVLAAGLRVVQVMTLMTMGPYHEPRGAYLPSILY